MVSRLPHAEKIAFVDMDGVLANFVQGVATVFGEMDLVTNYPVGEYAIENILGITADEFWFHIETHANFWTSLEPYGWTWSLLSEVRKWGYRPIICTKPSRDPRCAAQKIQWMHNHLSPNWRDYCLCQEKELLAAPGRILIDDHDVNCRSFAAAGGTSILFPQRWNSAHHIEDGFAHVVGQLNHAVR